MHLKTLVLLLFFLILVSTDAYTQEHFKKFHNVGANLTNDHELEEARKKKKSGGNKFLVLLLFGSLMIKSIIFPLAFKAMAVMSGIAVLLSTMSIIMSSIIGFVKLATKSIFPVKVVHKFPYNWAKEDNLLSANNYYDIENNALLTPPLQ